MVLILQASCLLALGVFALFAGIGIRLMAPDPMKRMLAQHGAGPHSLEEIEMSRPFAERVLIPLLRSIARVINRFTPQSNLEAMRHRLDVAGNPFNWTVVDFIGLRGLMGILLGLVLLGYAFLLHAALPMMALLGVTGTVLGFYLPVFWIGLKGRARKNNVQKALPDALDLLTISVEAGLGLDAAMQKVVQKWDNELSRGFARVLAEVRVGKLRRDALRDMADRMEVEDVSNFIAAVIQAEQLGVSITNVLRIQSEQMRIKRRQRAQEKAQQAPIKMLIPLAFMIFPAMFIIVLGPAVIRLVTRGILPQ